MQFRHHILIFLAAFFVLSSVAADRYYSSDEIVLTMNECGRVNKQFLDRFYAFKEDESDLNLEAMRKARKKADAVECGIPLDNLYWALSAGTDLVCGNSDKNIVRALFKLIIDTPNSASEIPGSALYRMMECNHGVVEEVFKDLSNDDKQQYLGQIRMTEDEFIVQVLRARASKTDR